MMGRSAGLGLAAFMTLVAGCAPLDGTWNEAGYDRGRAGSYGGGASPGWGAWSFGSSPGWGYRSNRSAWGGWDDDDRYGGRYVRNGRNTVCDRGTQICYKRGNIDKSATQDAFGGRAADRADDIRDRYGRGDLYVPRRNVACDRGDRVCYKNGRPDRSETRDVFGKKAARKVD